MDEYNDLLGRAVKASYGPSDLEQEAREVLDETGLTPREIYNELVILKERYANQVGITEIEISKLKAERDRLKKVLRKLLHAVDTGDWYNDAITCEGKEVSDADIFLAEEINE